MLHAQLKNVAYIYWRTLRRSLKGDYSYRASALAFTSLLSIVPLLFVSVFFITAFPIFTRLVLASENYILANFVPESAAAIQFYFHNFISQTTHLPIISILFLLFTATMLVHTIEEALNHIWGGHESRINLTFFLLYLMALIILPVIIGLSVILSAAFFSLPWVLETTNILGITNFLITAIPILINTMIFCLVYTIIPNTTVKFTDGLFGAFNAAFLLELTRMGFGIYLQQFPSYALIYGAFAIIPIFLLWLYIFWFIVLLGALVSHERSKLLTH